VHWIRRSLWLVALLPVAVALCYVLWAAPYPEPVAARAAQGLPGSAWDLATWYEPGPGPWLPGQRGVLLGLLAVPGLNLQFAAALTVLLAIALVWSASRSVATAAGCGPFAAPLAFGALGALALAPAFGQDWLQAERFGVVVPPLLLVVSLQLLGGERGFVWRALLVLLLAALAPTFHAHGALVGIALWPAVAGAATRSGRIGAGWAGLVAVVGAAVAGAGWWHGGWHGSADATVHKLGDGTVQRLWGLLEEFGRPWLELWRDSRHDERAFGALGLVLAAALPWLPKRPDAAPADRWWSCVLFGLLVVGFAAVYLPSDTAGDARRALGYGAFLLPVGLCGVVASRFGREVWAIGLGATVVLGLQDWWHGDRLLRHARVEAARVAAAVALPAELDAGTRAALSPYADLAVQQRHMEAGIVPTPNSAFVEVAQTSSDQPANPGYGVVTGGSPIEAHGTVRQSLVGEPIGAVVVVAVDGTGRRLRGATLLASSGGLGAMPFRVSWSDACAEGTRLVVMAFLPGSGTFARLSGPSLVSGGKLLEPTAGG
jgi:hypothetical protein